jgi:hypothetical protein
MRFALTAFAVAAALAAGLQSAGAVHNAQYCMHGASGNDCSFHTWKQCMAAAHGHTTHCIQNPRWRLRTR